ncbi:hypothetical protein OG760_13650 [Streptomyces sp. NBC_00963]|uniref:hypothetical protein n=1 Tax=unclassified Streptomyces TaxID=2593676 RepID=UPI00225AD233|nr:hypothetical protein [Streptomyces sp. NBC_01306]MCX4726063.1 hypothetical protein [Streptomyces sp. NBC_01306]WSX42666.1 hypothetical protein OG760_13650 [Streptomyces sp. NBC_00963]WSX69296.1 hypothetical protein OG221_23345 [Streptomyces sp. NBC_00932]
MSEIVESTAHEAYSFACMRCGHGWEQSYDIEHHVGASGEAFVVYRADGERVPSPLSDPNCMNCGGHVVRIMRSGRVSSVQNLLHYSDSVTSVPAGAVTSGADRSTAHRGAGSAAAAATVGGATPAPGERHHWQLRDLLHPFHRGE